VFPRSITVSMFDALLEHSADKWKLPTHRP